MKVLLLDSSSDYPANPLFAEALKELEQEEPVQGLFLDEADEFGGARRNSIRRLLARVASASRVGTMSFNNAILRFAKDFGPDITLIVKGAFVLPGTLADIKRETGSVLVNYAPDDPFNPRASTRHILRSIPLYDLYVSCKRSNLSDLHDAGAKRTAFVPVGYKPLIHFPEEASPSERAAMGCDVSFVGAADPDRARTVKTLLAALPGLDLRLYGGFWDRYSNLKRYYHGMVRGRSYRLVMATSKINLNLLRRSNRDAHAMRSFEIPACGGFMLTERTPEHLDLFAEDRDCAFYSTTDELIQQIQRYLHDDDERKRIAENGHERITTEPHTYLDRLRTILDLAEGVGH